MIKKLSTCHGERQMMEALNSTPSSIESIYEQALRRIVSGNRDPARDIFRLLVCDAGALEIPEIVDFAGLNTSRELSEICTSTLVRPGLDRSGKFGFSHPSVKEYLVSGKLSSNQDLSCFGCSIRGSNLYLTLRCVERLSTGKPGPFYQYAQRRLLSHYYKACEDPSFVADVLPVPKLLLDHFSSSDSKTFRNWRKRFPDGEAFDWPPEACPTPLHAALQRCPNLATAILNKNPADINRSSIYGTPLQLAIRTHHYNLVQLMLRLGADPDASPGSEGFGTAMFVAIECFRDWQLGIPELIFNKDLKATLDATYNDAGTPLHLASAYGHWPIVAMFTAPPCDINAVGGIFGDALQAAAALGHEKIVQTLLEYGANPNRLHGALGSAYLAAESGLSDSHKKIAALLEARSPPPSNDGALWLEAVKQARVQLSSDLQLRDIFITLVSAPGLDKKPPFSLPNSWQMQLHPPQQERLYVYRLTQRSSLLGKSLQPDHCLSSGLKAEIMRAFDQGEHCVWDDKSEPEEYNTRFAFHKHLLRALIHQLVIHVRALPLIPSCNSADQCIVWGCAQDNCSG